MSTSPDGITRTDPGENLPLALRDAFAALNDLVIPHLIEHGFDDLRRAHAAVFPILDGGSTVSVLAQRAGMTKQAMGELVLYLEQHGYVSREPDPADGRAKLVRPTQRGLRVIEMARSLAPALEKRVAALIGDERLRQLRHDLELIRREFRESPPASMADDEAR